MITCAFIFGLMGFFAGWVCGTGRSGNMVCGGWDRVNALAAASEESAERTNSYTG